jgi:hypothetical protein
LTLSVTGTTIQARKDTKVLQEDRSGSLGGELMTLMLDLPPDLEGRLAAGASRLGVSPVEYAIRLIEECLQDEQEAAVGQTLEAPSARDLLLLSPEQRDCILAEQAEDAASLYNDDLALPVADRELTAFTALDGEPFDDDE